MKNLFAILLLAASAAAFGRTYKNTDSPDLRVSYSFRLVKKLNDRAGIFKPVCDRTSYVPSAVGKELMARGGGGKVVKEAIRKHSEEKINIVIVGVDLKQLADGNTIPLGNDRTLHQIGTCAVPRGKTLAVFSYNQDDKVSDHLPVKSKSARTPSSIYCPHCGQNIKIVPAEP